jgi:hypothetical protein
MINYSLHSCLQKISVFYRKWVLILKPTAALMHVPATEINPSRKFACGFEISVGFMA